MIDGLACADYHKTLGCSIPKGFILKKIKLHTFFATIVFLGFTQTAVASINQGGLNTYVCLLKNAVLLIQFTDISGHITGNYISNTLNSHGTGEQVDEKYFTGYEGDGTISITFQYGGNWIGKVHGKQIDFQIPNFIVGEPLSSVVFNVSTQKEYNNLRIVMEKLISRNQILRDAREKELTEIKDFKHREEYIGRSISYQYKKLSRLENEKILSPEKVKEQYIKQIDLAKKIIAQQLKVRKEPNHYGKNYSISSLNYDVSNVAFTVSNINFDLSGMYGNAKSLEAGIKDAILSIKRNCIAYNGLPQAYKNNDILSLCNNEQTKFASADLFSKKVKDSAYIIKEYQTKYDGEMKTLQETSNSIK
ncbi:hypothetical protein [Acidithiobacillus concretivorus]|uniref:Uncharacterized protein n=1 Tax=Acidithiobacillus concretivorus TaxID=3063952 RepID=A0ABS5ZTR0_9PROT|nr:hypothetical protein [Acidithiobacillus concretivorus]MBU2740019.1 hypothetical protein [Acidithiobacillus concretivorus]